MRAVQNSNIGPQRVERLVGALDHHEVPIIDVNLGARSYPIHISTGVMEQTPDLNR